jgi:hypothetical protein
MASKNYEEPGIVVQAFNPHPRKSEVGGSQVQDQTGRLSETPSQKKKKEEEEKWLRRNSQTQVKSRKGNFQDG